MGAENGAVEALYGHLGPPLLAYARSMLRDAASAEDVVHEVFLKLISTRESLPVEPRPYLFRAVRNTSLNRLRTTRRETAQRMEPAMFVARDGLSSLVPDLERALAALPEEQREAVVLRVWAGLTLEEVAQVAGTSANTAASRYRYGLARLRERFGTHLEARRA
jgi:RNA polymerase sigma factor (sigma-70 family)